MTREEAFLLAAVSFLKLSRNTFLAHASQGKSRSTGGQELKRKEKGIDRGEVKKKEGDEFIIKIHCMKF